MASEARVIVQIERTPLFDRLMDLWRAARAYRRPELLADWEDSNTFAAFCRALDVLEALAQTGGEYVS